MARSNPGVHTVKVGDFIITAINDGQFEASADIVRGLPAAEAEAAFRDAFRVLPPRITVSCFLIEAPDHTAVIDFGCGTLFGPNMGKAGSRLALLGVEPARIGTVLLTHGHFDHFGGLLTGAGAPAFPDADLVIGRIEAGHWTSDANRAAAPEAAQRDFDLVRRTLDAYGARVRTTEDGGSVLPGITARHLPGHTVGHMGFELRSGDASLLCWTDIVHFPGLQFAHPEASLQFDTDPDQARATRQAVFEQVASSGQLVAGNHLDFPLFGHVRRAGDAFAFEPLVWTPTAD